MLTIKKEDAHMKKKMKWEKPKLMFLNGEKAVSGRCAPGSGNIQGPCASGISASTSCASGPSYGTTPCTNGSKASVGCQNGGQFLR